MAVLTPAAFYSKWVARFADNSSREISELDMREFSEDIKDSFAAILSGAVTHTRVSLDVSGATPDMDMGSQVERTFYGSADVSGDKTLSFSNDSNLIRATLFLTITGGPRLITMPTTVIANTGVFYFTKPASQLIWNAGDGSYVLTFEKSATSIHLTITGPNVNTGS